MRVVVQRVSAAHVAVAGEITGSIGHGLLVLAGFGDDETEADLDWTAQKIVRLRIFSDGEGVMNRDVLQADGRILAVSQFTSVRLDQKGQSPLVEPGSAR
jgi:D-tyrosyl-tRNA(Tyr) deacylase